MASDPKDSAQDHRGLLEQEPETTRVELNDELYSTNWTRPPIEQIAAGAHKFGHAVGVFAVMALVTYIIPGLGELSPWRADEDYVPFWNIIGREFMGQGEKQAREAERMDELEKEAGSDIEMAGGDARPRQRYQAPEIPPYEPAQGDPPNARTPIEFPENLDSFFLSLTQTDLGVGDKLTRVSHWGDSVLGNDGITGAIRFALQKRFGDGGHGFHAMSQYDPSYRHKGVRFDEVRPWEPCYVIRKRPCGAQKRWGYGGSYAQSDKAAVSEFRTAPKGRFGQHMSTFELWYAGMPKGGELTVQIDNAPKVKLPTAAPKLEDRWQSFSMQPGAHRVRVQAPKGQAARAYGVVMENAGPGVVWDGMALIGSFTTRMRKQNKEHMKDQIAHRDPDLIVLMFGGNDMLREKSDLADTMAPYERDLGRLLDHLRAGKPQAACLIMSPIDHGERRGGKIVSRSVVPRMVAAQRRVAKAKGCAFFNTYKAMGGRGSIGRWFNRNPKLASGDLSHATWHGHKVIGRSLFFPAFMEAYRKFRDKMAGKPWPPGHGPQPPAGDEEEDVILLEDEDS